ncbi:hypothetical protein GCM10009860_21320 [Microbacterium mitrae]
MGIAAGAVVAGFAPFPAVAVTSPAPAAVVPSPATAAVVPAAHVVPSAGDVNDFTFDSVEVEYELTAGEDGAGHLTVVETYVANFTNVDTHRGMQRVLPTTFNGAPLHPHLVSITDENGKPRASDAETDDGNYLMTSRADDPVIGKQTYVFTYTLDNVAGFYADANVDEFYWDVVGAEWAQPFGEVSMTLHLDETLAEALSGDMSCYVGGWNSTDRCEISASADGRTISVAPGSLLPHQGVTIAVGFEPGTFVPFDGSYLTQGATPVQLGLVGLGIAGFIGAIVVRRTKMRDAPGHPVVVAQYEPPAGVDAMNAAVMLGRRASATTAEILEQAVRGTIYIREDDAKRKEFSLVLADPTLVGDANGQKLIDILFGAGAAPGAEVALKENEKLATELPAMVSATAAEQLAGGVRYTPPARWRVQLPIVLVLLGVAAFVVGIVISATTFNPTAGLIGGGAFALSLVGISMLFKRPFTSFGANLRDHLLGLKEFMTWAEADRIRMLQSPEGAERVGVNVGDPASMLRLYEPLLPFAVAFGIEKQWTKNMQVYYEIGNAVPLWYAGTTPFTAASLGSVVSSFTAASSASSSSSGSSGGGSVGGGGGGGGGGGV